VTAALAIVGVVVGAALQSATGFGFSLVAAPMLFAAVGPAAAVGELILLGPLVSLLTIATERRQPRPARREVALLLGWAIPGALAGVAVLRALSPQLLQIVLSIGIVAALALRHARRSAAPGPAAPWAAPLAGFAAGGMTTSTSAAGPPLVAYLLGRGLAPDRVRDTLTVCFLGLAPIGALALAVTATADALPDPVLLAVLIPATVLGQLSGRPLFARLARGERYEPVLTTVLIAAVALGLIGTFTV
jgi:uncharacterized membrane protein YfcA